MKEALGQVEDHLLDALFALEEAEGDDVEEFLAGIHWSIKDVMSEIKKYKEENL